MKYKRQRAKIQLKLIMGKTKPSWWLFFFFFFLFQADCNLTGFGNGARGVLRWACWKELGGPGAAPSPAPTPGSRLGDAPGSQDPGSELRGGSGLHGTALPRAGPSELHGAAGTRRKSQQQPCLGLASCPHSTACNSCSETGMGHK